MFSFDRESGKIEGLIINKTFTNHQNRVIRIGGPCELQKKFKLHNIP